MQARDEFAQQVRESIDIVDIVSDQTRLQRRGKRLLGLCPFHKEKTPSFSVDPGQGLYYCFGCGAGGDALGFHMRVTGDDFPTTLEAMARRYGIAIPARGEVSKVDRDRDEALLAALEFFREQLGRSTEATRYLERRRIDPQWIETYGLGFAPDAWQAMHDALGRRFDNELLLEAGLLGRAESGRWYDRFRHRLMFPIRSTTGRLVGFGGRTLGDDRAKYINTAETQAFQKGQILYGLDIARPAIREAGKVLLVEGYFDVLGAVHSGVEWTVAGMGTALTQQQAKLLGRYADEVILGYDGDRAGMEAARKAMRLLLPAGASVRWARFPAGQDPDSVRLDEGPEAVRTLIDSAADAVLLEIESIPPSVASDPQRTAHAAEEVAGLLQTVPDEILRRQYAVRAAGRLGVDDDLLLRAPARRSDERDAAPRQAPSTLSMEHQILRLLCGGARPEHVPPPEAFWDPSCRSVYAAWLEVVDEEGHGEGGVVRSLRGRLEGESVQLLARLTLDDGDPDAEEDKRAAGVGVDDDELDQLDDLLAKLERRWVARENRLVRDALTEAQREGDAERMQELLARKQELSRMLHGNRS